MAKILAGKYPQNIQHDIWLSTMLNKDVYKLTLDGAFIASVGLVNFHRLYSHVFFYSKVPVDQIDQVLFLQDQGFKLIDTSVVFEKPVEKRSIRFDGAIIRHAQAQDKQKVKMLAAESFAYSRFHLDPMIGDEEASRIKSEWVGNFFEGKRGEMMVVAQKNDRIIGFLQLLDDKSGDITIDLIGVDTDYRQQGIASAMTDFAQAQCSGAKKIVVGTQIANVPSMRCYEKLGFNFSRAFYVFHYHG